MNADALDLAPLDRALTDLVDALDGRSLEDVMLNAGGIVQSAWRDNIQDADLVETGEYLESIAVEVVDPGKKRFGVRVQVGTDARTEDGKPYPLFLEYGTDDIFPHPVAQRAFDTRRRAVVQQVSGDLERKVRSRRER